MRQKRSEALTGGAVQLNSQCIIRQAYVPVFRGNEVGKSGAGGTLSVADAVGIRRGKKGLYPLRHPV